MFFLMSPRIIAERFLSWYVERLTRMTIEKYKTLCSETLVHRCRHEIMRTDLLSLNDEKAYRYVPRNACQRISQTFEIGGGG
jgi:hypothetical protein